MKYLLLIIGDDIKINNIFLDYIFKSYIDKFGNLGDIKFIDKSEKNIFDIIKENRKMINMDLRDVKEFLIDTTKYLITAVSVIFIILYVSYTLVGSILKKKGMTINES